MTDPFQTRVLRYADAFGWDAPLSVLMINLDRRMTPREVAHGQAIAARLGLVKTA